MMTSLRIDRLHNTKLVWRDAYRDPDSEDYRLLSYEATNAVSVPLCRIARKILSTSSSTGTMLNFFGSTVYNRNWSLFVDWTAKAFYLGAP